MDAPVGSSSVVVTASPGKATAPFAITLSQYAPVLVPAGNQGNFLQAFHSDTGRAVNLASPASPNETIGFFAIGLGPTQPPVATGVVPANPAPATTTLPTASLDGKPATVVSAVLNTSQVASYVVRIKVPADSAAGDLPLTLSMGGVTSNTLTVLVSRAPYVTSVSNAASAIVQGLPNSGIAQGAIFTVFGGLLGPDTIAISPTPFQSTTLSGTSLSVTVGGTTVSPLLYYTSAGQVAALLPSNTPTGTGAVTVTYNNQTSAPATISVVQNNVGIFTLTSNGSGAGIFTYGDYSLVSAAKAANCGGPGTACGAANPGDMLTLWATGLGPVNGSDAAGAGLGVPISVPMQLWVGGVQASVAYQGRSGYIGEDQINFTIPANAPTGCSVPLVIQINDQISNFVVIPIAAGSRTCTPSNPNISAAALAKLVSGAPIIYYSVSLEHRYTPPAGYQDRVAIEGVRATVAPGWGPFIGAYVDEVPAAGACSVSNFAASDNGTLLVSEEIDIGPQITVSGPNGSQSFSTAVSSRGTLSADGTYLTPGAYTISNGSGGADIKAFTAGITIPVAPTMTSPPPDAGASFSVTRSSGLPVVWSGGSANGYIVLSGQSATDPSNTVGASFECLLNPSAGAFTIPPYVLLALPPGAFASLNFVATSLPSSISGAGADLGFMAARRDSVANLTLR